MRVSSRNNAASRIVAAIIAAVLALALVPANAFGSIDDPASDEPPVSSAVLETEEPGEAVSGDPDETEGVVWDEVDAETSSEEGGSSGGDVPPAADDPADDPLRADGDSETDDGAVGADGDGFTSEDSSQLEGAEELDDPDAAPVDPVEPDDAGLEPGTYAVTANLAMPGEYNPVLSGVTVYANSPDNPFDHLDGTPGPVLDGNDPAGVEKAVPMAPESGNATLVVGADGARTLVLPIENPVFTTQRIGVSDDASVIAIERTAPADPEKWNYGAFETRVSRIAVDIGGDAASADPEGVESYVFTGSVLYAVPLDLELAPDGPVALELAVDFGSAQCISDETVPPALVDAGDEPDRADADDPDAGDVPDEEGGEAEEVPPATPTGPDDGQASGESHLAAGTYTVSANIWFDKSVTGLPLNPHLTSSSFPPMNPVENNATLTVDAGGRARVTVPLVIQSRVMTITSISGLPILSSQSAGGGLSSITVDLGVLSASDQVITRSCTASIHVGELAMTIGSGIFQGVYDHTWPATFQVNFSGVPNSGGGAIPSQALAIMSGTEGVSDTATAQADALAALEEVDVAAGAARSASGAGADGAGEPDGEDASSASGAAVGIVAGVVGVAVVVAIAFAVQRALRSRA